MKDDSAGDLWIMQNLLGRENLVRKQTQEYQVDLNL